MTTAKAISSMGKPSAVLMNGRVTGSMKGWDRWKDLPRIGVPALVIGSAYDELDPKDLERMAQMLPKGQYGFCPNGSHMCMWDDQENYFKILVPFLKG